LEISSSMYKDEEREFGAAPSVFVRGLTRRSNGSALCDGRKPTGLELSRARPYRLPDTLLMHTTKKALALRSVALFEAAKGVVVLLVGLGLLRLMHKNVDEYAEQLIRFLHVNPGGRLSNLFVTAASRANDKNLWALAAGAVVYALVRFAEAYGLWRDREWAEWFALLSGGMYLPWELYSLLHRPLLIKWIVLTGNAAIVLYMLVLRIQAERGKTRAQRAT
jgi:uncharacterized membrane protein (DUF2068 family)